MKNLVFLTIFFALIIYGCEKQEINDQLNGNWRIIGISGSIMGFQSIRDFDVVSFNHSGNYSVYFNDSVIQGGSFIIERQDPKEFGKTKIEFLLKLNESFDNHPYANFYSEYPMNIIFFGNDSLTLSQTGISDGFNYHFVKK